MLDDFGTLTVRAVTANNALPVSGAVVRITGAEEQNRSVAHSELTNRDGTTRPISLPAPNKSFSLTPNPTETPYAIYDMEISAEGYYAKRMFALPVFAGINSLQIVNMIPRGDRPIEDYPRGNINSATPENNT